MRPATLSFTLTASLLAAASSALASGLDLRVGGFVPRGHESLFYDLGNLYAPDSNVNRGVKGSDFAGAFGGAEFNTTLMPNVELGVHLDGYGRTLDTVYPPANYTREDGSLIHQRIKLEVVPLGATIRLLPTERRNAKLVPYLGGGVDAIFYKYQEFGDMIEFFDPTLPILNSDLQDEGTAFGLHALAGVRFYVNRDFAVVAEGRYQWAKKDMGHDFSQNEPGLVNTIDLSGAAFVVGVHVRF